MAGVVAVAHLLSIVLVGTTAGTFVATQLGQLRFQKTLNARDFTLVKHGFEVAVGRVMPVLVIAAGLSIVPVIGLAVGRRPAVAVAAVIALLLWVGVVVVTLVYCAPVNAVAATWDPSTPPVDWQALRDRWHLGQTLRTPLALGSFVTLAAGVVWPASSG